MDMEMKAELERAGLRVGRTEMLRVPIEIDPRGQVKPLDKDVPVMDASGQGVTFVKLKPISQLWTGTAVPPSLAGSPPQEYQPFLFVLELTAADYCVTTRKVETDAEFERLYRLLRRRPDGQDANPLFSYLQGAARLYLSLEDVSQAEFEAVAQRLSQSARHFATHVGSTNYYQRVLRDFLRG
ncbi:hypothetical protein [Archangium sp.]|uniref:hypothetical protein n=1 Tax=Archangium sp. TaxID=1872627 RepID=UPI002D44503B|nr:hypothetical protein [Archangium sp.]HYO58730.1 hypothetical protein [Archangium sp.]